MITRRTALGLTLAAPALLLAARTAIAKEPYVHSADGVAIEGYDPVAYFTEGKPVKGHEDHRVMWRGAVWQFATSDAMARFEADPVAYAPQYGCYCAYAVSRGYTASSDPQAWTVHEGRLYLNYSKSVRAIWARDIPGNIAKADANWPNVLG